MAEKLKDLEVVKSMPGSAYGLSVILPEDVDRDSIVRAMGQRQIEVSRYYRYALTQDGSCPVAEDFAKRVVTLSVGPHLGTEHMCHQANVLRGLL